MYRKRLRKYSHDVDKVKRSLVENTWMIQCDVTNNSATSLLGQYISSLPSLPFRFFGLHKRRNTIESFDIFRKFRSRIMHFINLELTKYHNSNPTKIMRNAASGILFIQDTFNVDARKFPKMLSSIRESAFNFDECNVNGFTPSDFMLLSLSSLDFKWYEKAVYFAEAAELESTSKKCSNNNHPMDVIYKLSISLKQYAKYHISRFKTNGQHLKASKYLPFLQKSCKSN